MDNPFWRGPARVVAILEMVYSIASLFLTILLTALSIYFNITDEVADEINEIIQAVLDFGIYPYDLTDVIPVMWIFVVILALLTVIRFWLTMTLFYSTKQDCNGPEAINMAKTWRNLNFIFLDMEIVGAFIIDWFPIAFVIDWIIRIIYLCIVHLFIRELEGVASSEGGAEGLEV